MGVLRNERKGCVGKGVRRIERKQLAFFAPERRGQPNFFE